MYPKYICEDGDCTSYGVITFEFWFDGEFPRGLEGKHYCLRHASYIINDLMGESLPNTASSRLMVGGGNAAPIEVKSSGKVARKRRRH